MSGLSLSPPESEGEDCEEKSRKLQVKRVKAGLDTGIWALTQGPRTAGQYSVRQVNCNTWSVQTWPERQGLGRQLQSVLLVLETQSRARSLAGTSQRILAGLESLFLFSSNVSITEFCPIFLSFSPHPYQHCVMNRSKM